jgi:SAM-dependent methyltransferase
VREEFLALAVCPKCQHRLVSRSAESQGDEVLSGFLACSFCGSRYEIKRGIPWFEPKFDEKTRANFGFSWRRFSDIYLNQKEDFLNWVDPVRPDFFEGKIVLDAGSGNGLHARFASEFGAGAVYAIDLSTAVEAAFDNCRDRKNVYVSQADIYAPPFKEGSFDYIYSIGVIQHLPEREKALKELTSLLKKGGHFSIWVYGYEGTFLVRTLIEPLRKIFLKTNLRFAYLCSFIFAALFYVSGKLYQGVNRIPGLGAILPMKNYLLYMARFPFRYQHNTVYDQLIAPRTHYFKKRELEEQFRELNFEKVVITGRNGMSWRVFAQNKY